MPELYTAAVAQLGDDKAPVRLGGLHALERLARSTPNQRQQQLLERFRSYRRPDEPEDLDGVEPRSDQDPMS